jgi:glycine/D-amino acid oxidase-like deaminating enzyme
MQKPADVIIAGAGLAGLLTLCELSRRHPTWTFELVEREPWIGGRLRLSSREHGSWSCGLHAMGAELFDYVQSVLQPDDTEILQSFHPREGFGVLAAQKISTAKGTSILAPEVAKAVGGTAATRDWNMLIELFAKEAGTVQQQGEEQGQELAQAHAFNQVWKGDKKSAALIVLEHLAHLWGVPELSPASAQILSARALQAAKGQWTGPWDRLFEPLIGDLRSQDRLIVHTRAQIMAAKYEEKTWQLATTVGAIRGQRLVVAQSPWEATPWLPKDLWPSKLLNIASKTKPVSLVILSQHRTDNMVDLPQTLMIPAEEVQVQIDAHQICYQATLNFELTVQAPAVVKAVKRLKRARKKLETVNPELKTEGEHIALLPVAWAQTVAPSEQRWLEKMDGANVQRSHLGYCGDAYGAEADSDRNLIASVKAVCEAMS